MSTKHTPGPWQVHGSHVYTADPERALLAQVFNPGSKASDYPLVANARLIAAAPRMLHELYAAAAQIEALGGDARTQRAAIVEANGEQP